MSHPIPPEVQAHIATGVAWLWGQYGQKFVEKIAQRGKNEANWRWSIEKYYTSLYERVGFIRILGRMEAEPLENVFTHVNVLDKLSAERRYDIPRLMAEFSPRDFSWAGRVKRVSDDKAVAGFPKLFILGKPGAGKTTFLKHTALRAINHEIQKVPVFVTLKELSDSGMAIVPFIVHQFKVHQLPEPELFVEPLLKSGNAIVLFDGLDEVNLEDNKRADLIQAINDFVYQYSDCPILLTCRVAATDYSFTQFEYVEMADFDEEQMGRYIDLWFVGDEVKRVNCHRALLEDGTNKAVRELAQVPLLLALLCLVYEERGKFPPNRDEIYDEATRALLSKWDSSRNIPRDVVYKQLSLKHKQNMLAFIAAKTFADGEYFLPEKKIVGLIDTYLQGVLGIGEPDGELILKAMEAQHGIFVEQARCIHSFSHLTLQEYYTARYIVDNQQQGSIVKLMGHVGDDRWREVFKLTASMLDDAGNFFEQHLRAIFSLLKSDPQLLILLGEIEQKSKQISTPFTPLATRAFLLYIAHNLDYADDFEYVSRLTHFGRLAQVLGNIRNFASDIAYSRDQDVARDITLARFQVEHRSHQLAYLEELGKKRISALYFDLNEDLNEPKFNRKLSRYDHLLNIYFSRKQGYKQDDYLELCLILGLEPASDTYKGILTRALVHYRDNALQIAEELNLVGLKTELESLSKPSSGSSVVDDWMKWRKFARRIVTILDKYQLIWDPNGQLTRLSQDPSLFAHLSQEQINTFVKYLESSLLLINCLTIAGFPNRAAIEERILRPLDDIE